MLTISGRLLALTKCEIEYRDKQISQAERTSHSQSSDWHGEILKKRTPSIREFLTLRPFGAKPMSGQIIAKNSPKRIFPSDLRGELIAITKTDIKIASHGNPRKTRVSPLQVGQGRGYG